MKTNIFIRLSSVIVSLLLIFSFSPPPTHVLTAYAQESSELKDLSEVRNRDWNTDGDTLEVTSAEDMAQFCYLSNLEEEADDYVDLSDKTINLTEDIDLGGIDWPGAVLGENSVFDGKRHTVTIFIDYIESGDIKTYSMNSFGLFAVGNADCEIKNLNVSGKISVREKPHFDHQNNPCSISLSIVGSLVGEMYGTISNCTSDVDISSAYAYSSYIGGICGYSEGDIINCVFSGSIDIDEIAGCDIGGIAADILNANVELCKNTADINCEAANASAIGGISGYAKFAHFMNCLNSGNISSSEHKGGFINIAGILATNSLYGDESKVIIEHCLNTGNIIPPEKTVYQIYSGAIFGITNGQAPKTVAEVSNCYALTDTSEKLIGNEIGVVIDTNSSFVNEVNGDLADKLNDGQDKEYWEITDDGDISFNTKDEDEDDDDNEDKPHKHGSSYSLEEKERDDDDDNKEPEITEPEENEEISDIGGHWAEPFIKEVISKGYMDNVIENQFFPDSSAARITVAEALYRLAGSPSVDKTSPFIDSSANSIVWANANGILAGFEDGTVRPNDTVTREQLALIIYNYQKYMGKDVSNIEGMKIYEFSDWESISDWANTAVRYCLNAGILNGNTDGTFNPKGNVTRAELAVIINNLH